MAVIVNMSVWESRDSLWDYVYRSGHLDVLRIAYAESGRPREAIARYELALDLHQRSGRAIGEALTLADLGNLYRDSGQLARAVGHFENALRIYRAEGSGATEAYSLCALGDVYRQLGRLDKAEIHVNDALALSRKLHSHDGTIMALHSLAGSTPRP